MADESSGCTTRFVPGASSFRGVGVDVGVGCVLGCVLRVGCSRCYEVLPGFLQEPLLVDLQYSCG